MSKQFYRGYEVVSNDNMAAKVVTREAVYRGAKYDPSAEQPGKPVSTVGRMFYRGARAA